MTIKISGLKEVQKRLSDMARRAEALSGDHKVPLDELFTPTFMSAHTSLSSFDELIEKGGFTVNSPADFDAIPDDEWDRNVRANTSFGSWEEMLGKAGEEWTAKKMGF